MGKTAFFALPLISVLFDGQWTMIQTLSCFGLGVSNPSAFFLLPLVHTALPALAFLSMTSARSAVTAGDGAVRLPGLI